MSVQPFLCALVGPAGRPSLSLARGVRMARVPPHAATFTAVSDGGRRTPEFQVLVTGHATRSMFRGRFHTSPKSCM